jgi:hypothetical protein
MSKRRSPPKIPESADADTVLDMIDQRIGHLLVRSGDLESKIERLESEAVPVLHDESSSKRSRLSTGRSAPASQAPSEERDITSLVRMVLSLQETVQEIREEQRRTSQQINDIHFHLKKLRRS